jgi:hypothetical protein
MKVAQYKVLGNEAKNRSVPSASGTIEMLGFWSCTRLSDRNYSSIVPFLRRRPDYGGQAGTDGPLKTLTQHFVLGLLSLSPSLLRPPGYGGQAGTKVLTVQS